MEDLPWSCRTSAGASLRPTVRLRAVNHVGDRVGPYELVELLAVRPQANLWRATRVTALTRGQREVVLRVVHDTNDLRAMEDLRREYDALRAIDDPRVRKAIGLYAGFGALALEFVDGVSLTWAVEKVRAGEADLDVATIIDLAVEIANALRMVHEAGVVHGRLCLDTVRLRRDGGVVLTDFALPLDRLPVLPPELGLGHPATTATDQWLLGALVCNLLLGEALLGGTTGAPADGARDLDPTIRRVQATWPPLGRWLLKTLAADPRERYATEGLLVKDLLAALRSSDNPPRRDALARRLHTGRPAAVAAPRPRAVAVPADISPAAEVVSPRAMPLPAKSPPPTVPVPRVEPALFTGNPPPAETISSAPEPPAPLRSDTARPVTRHAASLTPSYGGEQGMVQAVLEEQEDDQSPLPEPQPVESPPRPPALVPDWAAAWALVLLLAVGLWAVLVRVF